MMAVFSQIRLRDDKMGSSFGNNTVGSMSTNRGNMYLLPRKKNERKKSKKGVDKKDWA